MFFELGWGEYVSARGQTCESKCACLHMHAYLLACVSESTNHQCFLWSHNMGYLIARCRTSVLVFTVCVLTRSTVL